ncbi:MAG TPA: two-component regulator propeller domain-containing protein [Ignavibacteriaceae bacterium]|nr:two-component regulator propeller domain-containing protein [Ignavibacteriaceae bacterium]
MMIYLRKIIYLFFLLIIVYSKLSQAQNNQLKFTHIGADEGLSQNQVFCIFQDSKGLLWIGTQEGLNLYDGYKFRIFRHQPGNINSLPDYAVNTICESDTGIFWIGTREGLSRLDLQNEIFTHYKYHPDSSNSIVDKIVWGLKKDSDGYIWLATGNGLSRFNPATEKFTNYKHNPYDKNSISHNFLFTLTEDDNKNIWIGGRGGIDRFNLEEGKFHNYKIHPEKPNSVKLNGVISMFLKKDILWVAAYSGLYSADISDLKGDSLIFKRHLEKETSHAIRSLYVEEEGTVWVGTMGDGLFRYNPQTGSASNFKKTNNAFSLSGNEILSIYEDDDKVLWVGTYFSGLSKYNISSEKFRKISITEPGENKFSAISSLTEDHSGNLWVGTKSGNILKVKNHFSGKPSFQYYNTDKNLDTYFSSIEIKSIIEDKEGKIWAGSFGKGIYIIDPLTNKVKRILSGSNNGNSIANDYIHTIYESGDGTIWIGTGAGGLNKYDPVKKLFTHYKPDPKNDKSITLVEVTSVCQDNRGYVWAGTSIGGLNRLDPATGEFEHFMHNVSDVKTIGSNRILCLYPDNKSSVWIGTFGGGLNKFDYNLGTFEYYTTEQGLPSNIVCSIVEDKNGNLWISTDKGISLFDVEQKTFKNYDKNDGLSANEFLHDSGFKSNNDFLYFGGVKGVNFFNPADFYSSGKLSDIVLTDFRIFNESVQPGKESPLKKNVLYAKEVVLTYDQDFITFEFASLDFNNPEKNQYAYTMEGFNDNWIKSGSQRFATYTNLDPGEYIFRVKATNSRGAWNDEGISIRVIMLPPWWQSLWAYIIYGMFFLWMLYSLRKYEIKRVKLRNDFLLKDFEAKKLLEVDQLKSHFFANISHEFRTPLTLILGLLQKFENKTSDKNSLEDYGVMRRNAIRLLQLINQLLELSSIEAGKAKLSASQSDIIAFVKRIFISFASYAEQKKVKLLFNEKPINQDNKFKEIDLYFDKDKMEKIISNLVSNAVKFTPAGNEIETQVIKHANVVEIKVINTGTTISRTEIEHLFDRYYKADRSESILIESTGIGLALVKELVEMHRGKIFVSSEYDITEFNVKFPLGREHLKDEEIIEEIGTNTQIDNYESKVTALTEEPTIIKENSDKMDGKDVILIVEDHYDLRKYVRENLEEKYRVTEAPDGKKGFEKALETIPDLIISDVMMPEMDGYAFCKKLKSNEKTNHIPVILLTAKASTEYKLEGLELGADDYLIKPFNPDELLLRVRNLISIREQLRNKFTSEMVLKPADVVVPSSQVQFMEKLKNIIEANMEDEGFGVDKLSNEMGMSRSQLHRKLKAITNQATTEFIRNFRLQRAAQLILHDSGSMAEIAYKVGFNSQAYFNKSFQEFFGCSPTNYKNKSD